MTAAFFLASCPTASAYAVQLNQLSAICRSLVRLLFGGCRVFVGRMLATCSIDVCPDRALTLARGLFDPHAKPVGGRSAASPLAS